MSQQQVLRKLLRPFEACALSMPAAAKTLHARLSGNRAHCLPALHYRAFAFKSKIPALQAAYILSAAYIVGAVFKHPLTYCTIRLPLHVSTGCVIRYVPAYVCMLAFKQKRAMLYLKLNGS